MTFARAVWRAAALLGEPSPYDAVHLRILFPGEPGSHTGDPLMGVVGPDRDRAPFPVVVLFGNFNCPPELYHWLAVRLVDDGYAVVQFTWVSEVFAGRPALSSGVDLDVVRPGVYGTRSPVRVWPAIAEALERADAGGELAGCLDRSRIVLGGHSSGGTLALMGGRWIDGVRAAFSYGGHTRAPSALGFDPAHVLTLPASPPSLLMGGTADGVVRARAEGDEEGFRDPVERTFDEALEEAGGAHRLVIVRGANHYAFTDGYDRSTGRGYLEDDQPAPADDVRQLLGDLVSLFCAEHLGGRDADAFAHRCTDPLVALFRSR